MNFETFSEALILQRCPLLGEAPIMALDWEWTYPDSWDSIYLCSALYVLAAAIGDGVLWTGHCWSHLLMAITWIAYSRYMVHFLSILKS